MQQKSINSLRSIEINDLLWEEAGSSKELLNNSINNSIVLITGAAGSIGSNINTNFNAKSQKINFH